jgi:ABC-2 type transport system ATP-binding protein
MDLVQRICDRVAIVAFGQIRAVGTLDEVRSGLTLEERFVRLVGGQTDVGGDLAWLRTSSS